MGYGKPSQAVAQPSRNIHLFYDIVVNINNRRRKRTDLIWRTGLE
jgi:hypothetical protein